MGSMSLYDLGFVFLGSFSWRLFLGGVFLEAFYHTPPHTSPVTLRKSEGARAAPSASLGWAPCDDRQGRQCRGDGGLHAACVAAFFATYNVNMLALSRVLSRRRPGADRDLKAMAALSLATKVRWAWPVGRALLGREIGAPETALGAGAGAAGNGPSGVGTLRALCALCEWLDYCLVVAWTACVVCRHRSAARFELIGPRGAAAPPASAALQPVAMRKAPGVAPGGAQGGAQGGAAEEGGAQLRKAAGEAEGGAGEAVGGACEAEVFVSVRRVAKLVLLLYGGTLLCCLTAALAQGRVKRGAPALLLRRLRLSPHDRPRPPTTTHDRPRPHTTPHDRTRPHMTAHDCPRLLTTRYYAGVLPYISDTFVYPPGDWISRWALPPHDSTC